MEFYNKYCDGVLLDQVEYENAIAEYTNLMIELGEFGDMLDWCIYDEFPYNDYLEYVLDQTGDL